MIDTVATALDAWERDDAVAAVLLDGAGDRGLCVGGDLRVLCDDRGRTASAGHLAAEYRLGDVALRPSNRDRVAQLDEADAPLVAIAAKLAFEVLPGRHTTTAGRGRQSVPVASGLRQWFAVEGGGRRSRPAQW